MNKIILCLVGMLLLSHCSNLSDRNVEQPFVISTIDLNEASTVRDILNNEPGLKGNFKVEAGSTVTTVIFSAPDEPVNAEGIRKGMEKIKALLTENRGREANTLKFIFKNITLEV